MIMQGSTFMYIAISLACILIARLSWRVLNWVWFNPRKYEKFLRAQGFQGNSYTFLYGESREMAQMIDESLSKPMPELSNDHFPYSFPFYHHAFKKYGPKSFIWFGPLPMINIPDPEHIKEIFKRWTEFQKPQVNPILKLAITGLVQLEGEIWTKHRRLVNPAFHMEKLKLMIPALTESCTEMLKKWEDLSSKTGSCDVNILPHLNQFSADVISRAAFGSSYEEGRRIFELITLQLKYAVPIIESPYLPGWRFIPTKTNRMIYQCDRKIKYLLKGVIDKRLEAIKAGEKPKNDLLGIMLDSNAKAKNEGINMGISLREVIDECQIFYLAGQETTSTLIIWTLVMLSKNPEWQKRARDEILDIFGDDVPDFQRLSQLKIVNMILHEVLRLYPPIPELIRTVYEDTKVGDITIPAGGLVHLPLMNVHHDEKIWGADALEFKPERFSEGVSKATRGTMSYFAFGGGQRICIGSNFAFVEAKFTLAMVLQRYSFEISPSYEHAPFFFAVYKPRFGARLIIRRLGN